MQIRNVLVILVIFGLGIGAGIVIKSYSTSNETVSKVLSTTDAESPGLSVSTNDNLDTGSESLPTSRISKIIDGDTFVLSTGQAVRLIGVDAPEKDDCFSSEATGGLSDLINGKTIRLEKDVSETDRYKRLLRYIWATEVFVNEELVRQGFATARDYPPDSKYKIQFVQAEVEAKRNKKGLWSVCQSENYADQPGSQSYSKPGSEQVGEPGFGSEDRDCGDFKTHAEAQAFFSAAGPGDPHRLDSNGDGIACESLP